MNASRASSAPDEDLDLEPLADVANQFDQRRAVDGATHARGRDAADLLGTQLTCDRELLGDGGDDLCELCRGDRIAAHPVRVRSG